MSTLPLKLRRLPWAWVILVAGLLAHGTQAFLYPHPPVGDELRYLRCAEYITQGFLTPADNPDYVNGPGYPALLSLFLGWDAPRYLAVRLLHACLATGAALLLYATVKHYAGRGWAAAGAFFLLFHPNTLRTTPQLLTEPLTLLCVCAFAWSFCHAQRAGQGRERERDQEQDQDQDQAGDHDQEQEPGLNHKPAPSRWLPWALLCAVALAWLILTRVMFGHVAVATLVFSTALFALIKRLRRPLGRTMAVVGLALALCVPYLADTYEKTGKIYCWSTNSGELLYWITSTNEGERGNWFDYKDAMTHRDLAPNHAAFFQRVTALPALQRDAAFTEAAKQHIKDNPKGVLQNWVFNTVRLCFNTPRSFKPEELKTLVITAFNAPLILLTLLALGLAWRHPQVLPVEVAVLCGFAAIYFGGSTLAASLARYFLVVTPLFWLMTATILSRTVSIRFGISKL